MISLNPGTLLSGSGIDVSSLVKQALAQEATQQTALQDRQSELQNQGKLLSGINGDLNSLAAAVRSLSDILGPLKAMSAQSSQTGIVTASAQASAVPGTHTVVVSTLATQGTLYTDAVQDADTSLLPANAQNALIQFQVGGSAGVVHDIPISAGTNDSINKIVAYINSQNWGVTASVLTDSSGARLAISSQETGTAGALSISSNTSGLSFNPPAGGTDAQFTVDGIPFASATNNVSGAIPGVSLNLLGAYPGIQVQIAVSPDAKQAGQAIQSFVSAYNAVIGDLNAQFTFDPATNSQGPLASDSSLRSLQSRLLGDATYSPGTGAYTNLAALGISMNDDGTLSVNSGQLLSTIESDPSAVLNFFQNAGQSGFADHFSHDLQNLTDPTQGLLYLDLAQNQVQQREVQNGFEDFQARMAAEQKSLERQFSVVNALLEAFPSQLQAVQQMLGLNTSSSSK